LAAEPDTLAGKLNLYEGTSLIRTFRANFPMSQVRQVEAAETAVYVLDRNGRRLLQFDGRSGTLQHVQQLPQSDPASAFWVSPDGQIILAGRNRLYFGNNPARLGHVPPGDTFAPSQFYDPLFLASLSPLGLPIGGSPLTVRDFQLPGAPRHYRLGVHEGLDFYWQRGTPVTAVADGVVIRANTDFVQPSPAEIAARWQAVSAQGYTDDATLDFYRGRQVWIEHDNGLISRYVHLDTIAPGVQVGTAVTQGQLIGTVGNSGSPSSLESVDADVHLHFELWYDDAYLGQYLRPIEAREWILRLFYNEYQN
jgi:murein DD-endopeptidase MepM/ murein hydrolase activator NlpD